MSVSKRFSLGVVVLLVLAIPSFVHLQGAELVERPGLDTGGGSVVAPPRVGESLGGPDGDPDDYVFYYEPGYPDSLRIEGLDPYDGAFNQQNAFGIDTWWVFGKIFRLFVFAFLF